MLLNKIKEIENIGFIVELAILLVINYKNSNIQEHNHAESDCVLLLDTKIPRTQSDIISEWSEKLDKKNIFLSNIKEIKNENNMNLFIWGAVTFSSSSLGSYLSNASSGIISEYSENKEIKGKVIQLLMNDDIDIMKLEPDIIQDKLCSLPEVQNAIILEAMRSVANENDELIGTLSSAERKYIIFEFIFLAKKLNMINLSDLSSVNYLFSIFKVGTDYLSEFEDIVYGYSKLDSELLEILNE